MDPKASDIEFFDFENVSEDEIRKIRYMLKDPKSSGCVELPWKIKVEECCNDSDYKGSVQTIKALTTAREEKVTVTESLQCLTQISPTPLHAPATDNFVTIPTTIGYNNAPYFVTRTLPYLRAYPHLGAPFFSCPIPGTGETQPTHYSQFVPFTPTFMRQEKLLETKCSQKKTEQSHFQHDQKKVLNYSSGIFQVENSAGLNKEVSNKHLTIATPVSSTVENECLTSVSLVPLPLPPASFAVAGGTLPLHGYPPGLSTLSYTQMPSHQTPSTAVYYVPIFNHPYGSYMPSPPSTAVVLPVSLHQGTEVISTPPDACNNKLLRDFSHTDNLQKKSLPDHCKNSSLNVQTELQSLEQLDQPKQSTNKPPPNSVIPSNPTNSLCNDSACSSLRHCNVKQHNASQGDSDIVSNECCTPNKQSTLSSHAVKTSLPSNSNQSLDAVSVTKAITMKSDKYSSTHGLSAKISIESTISIEENISSGSDQYKKEVNVNSSRRWADLFHIPSPEVNGVSEHHSVNRSVTITTENLTNGKIFSVPTNDGSIEQSSI